MLLSIANMRTDNSPLLVEEQASPELVPVSRSHAFRPSAQQRDWYVPESLATSVNLPNNLDRR